ncbi:putative benzoate 4-monooxygenase cytochrome P450 [Dothidotthia symphoricarpi CBS 119687]|uniref:Putative benzoate 4-monooxygenase cytochrome P450 n=1 Tax=Dothidotthia symphoricarpi CBS 119687 TaxID=1392245 RepID=A0A6A6AG45_9PLEO|nr:putative benzoate 4-monooxygenase cytochrome P450 [Dothidotthia symphoricarpi CBS 119687]KAF2130546.1 putative benzoate 4-monooxygenase cytochrome P450 [Dothidotthia symphoricarpi CBS 119687]
MASFFNSFFQDAYSTAGSAALLGILLHQAIRNVEFELYMFHFMAASVVSFFGLIYGSVHFGGHSVPSAFARASLFATSFNTALLSSIAVYRLVFHRCRSFPGPFGAKVTRFYAAYLSSRKVQYYKDLAEMHATYGDFVRTGPREISILRKSAVPTLYGPNSELRKSTMYGQTGNDQKKTSIHMTRDRASHRVRRRAWDRGFSMKALATYEPRIKTKADALIHQLRNSYEKPMNVSSWAMYFSFDVMGEVGLGKDFNNLTSGVEHGAIQGVHDHMTMLGILSTVPWLLNVLSSIPGAASGYTDFFNFCSSEIREKNKHWDKEKQPQDVISWLLKAMKDKDASAAPSPEAMEDDTRVIIIAGSETTATTLAGVLYFLAKNPDKQKKLQALVDQAIPTYNEWSYDKVRGITYIDDWINETLRLRPALLNGGPRETTSKGIQIDEVYIPGNTNVCVPVQLIQKDPRWWPQAEEFVPERFGERRAEMGTENAPYMPFSLGAYSCPGKNLAQLSLRISISSIVKNFDVSFAQGETGEEFANEVLDTFTVTLPPLQLSFKPRDRA